MSLFVLEKVEDTRVPIFFGLVKEFEGFLLDATLCFVVRAYVGQLI